MESDHSSLLRRIRLHYEESPDFNGLSVNIIEKNERAMKAAVIALIREGEVDLVRGDGHPNPHIKAFPADSIDEQTEKIERDGLGHGCLYPTPAHLERQGAAQGEPAPYTRALKLGEPQLTYRVFDLRVLEWYRNDPRFSFEVDDIHGSIHQNLESSGPSGAVIRDKLEYLEFGFAYDDQLNRAIAVFLRYLHDLPVAQQQYLSNYELSGSYELHPEFYRTQIIGGFPDRISIYDAFLDEKHHINNMCKLIGKVPLFKSEYRAYQRPSGFGILIRPTNKEFRDFALMLDQLFGDDINREFFKGEISTSEILTREDGSTVTQPVGTITLLERWIQRHFRPEDTTEVKVLFQNLRKIRKERQKPAHQLDNNNFDQVYITQQRELIGIAFRAVRTIRMILENHPAVRYYEVPDWLREGKIWSM